jgi:hypothetical protein
VVELQKPEHRLGLFLRGDCTWGRHNKARWNNKLGRGVRLCANAIDAVGINSAADISRHDISRHDITNAQALNPCAHLHRQLVSPARVERRCWQQGEASARRHARRYAADGCGT